MFEKASRKKLRFETLKGNLTAEDLWDLPLLTRGNGLSLDNIAKGLNKQIKEADEDSFVVEKSTANTTLELKFDIVKYIIKVKLEEKEIRENLLAKKAQKEKILSIISKKEDESLENTSLEDLKKMAESL